MKMIARIFTFMFALSVIVSAEVIEDDEWSCETVTGTPCSGSRTSVQGVGRRHPYITAFVSVSCTDKAKTESNTYLETSTVTSDEKATVVAKCLSGTTPCMKDFKVCIKDPGVQPVTLSCRYLKDYEGQNMCGTDGAKNKTYLMESGHSETKIEYNCERIYIEKAVTEEE